MVLRVVLVREVFWGRGWIRRSRSILVSGGLDWLDVSLDREWGRKIIQIRNYQQLANNYFQINPFYSNLSFSFKRFIIFSLHPSPSSPPSSSPFIPLPHPPLSSPPFIPLPPPSHLLGTEPFAKDQINRVISHPTLPVTITAHEDKHIRFFDNKTGEEWVW